MLCLIATKNNELMFGFSEEIDNGQAFVKGCLDL